MQECGRTGEALGVIMPTKSGFEGVEGRVRGCWLNTMTCPESRVTAKDWLSEDEDACLVALHRRLGA
jgi:hypothetical protein